tara:strand:+ start:367 stop:612 length:246 start_codon:yes stop_codon:yes gene_type:complete
MKTWEERKQAFMNSPLYHIGGKKRRAENLAWLNQLHTQQVIEDNHAIITHMLELILSGENTSYYMGYNKLQAIVDQLKDLK